jgi:hypothetical protein
MAVAVGDTQASAVADTQVSAAAPVRAELVVATAEPGLAVATVELESADPLAHMPRGSIHLQSQRDDMADMADMGKGTTRREPRPEDRLMVQLRGRKIGPLSGSLLVRQITPVATTSREVSPELALPGNPICNLAIIRELLHEV